VTDLAVKDRFRLACLPG